MHTARIRQRLSLPTLLFLVALGSHAAELRLAACFSDGMLLQRDRPARVWGTAGSGETVAVRFGGQSVTVQAGADGRWTAVLPPMPAEATGRPLTAEAGPQSVTLTDVLVGDVWLCAGQSNMAVSLAALPNAIERVGKAHDPGLRILRLARQLSATPQQDLPPRQQGWTSYTPAGASNLSAVAAAFGVMLRQRTGVPIGIVTCTWPGTFIESWMPIGRLQEAPELAPVLRRWNELMAAYPQLDTRQQKAVAEWQAAHGKRFAIWRKQPVDGPFVPHAPSRPPAPDSPLRPGAIYNGMLAPVASLGLKGVAWYQGESNTDRAYQYRHLLRLLVRSWRDAWGEPELPFVLCQLPEFETDSCPYDYQDSGAWEVLRESQAAVLDLPATALAVTLGLGERFDVHPLRKQEVGQRLALAALKAGYGSTELCSGPHCVTSEVHGASMRVRFRDVGEGLLSPGGGALRGFVLAGPDRVFHPAAAVIVAADTVAVTAAAVPSPVAVRYAWDDDPAFSLCGSTGLPAAPFRSDRWPVPTQDAVEPLAWLR